MKEKYLKNVGKELIKLREENNLSVPELALKTRIPTSTIYRYEAGMGIKLDKLADLIKPYKIDLYIFFERMSAK